MGVDNGQSTGALVLFVPGFAVAGGRAGALPAGGVAASYAISFDCAILPEVASIPGLILRYSERCRAAWAKPSGCCETLRP